MSIEVITFGCRLNAYESEVMQIRAVEAGLQDAVLVNTCAVTGEAVRQARQAIRQVKRRYPDRHIVVTGCAAQTEPQTFAAMPEVDRVIGNAEKLTSQAYDFTCDFEKVRVNDIFSVRETAGHLAQGFAGRTRAFVQVQNGCDHRCTFCIIPYGRGNSRSVPMGCVVREVCRLVENGCKEVVLTGVDITSYGGDLPGAPRLGTLVRSIMKHVPALPRLRLSSLDSIEVDAELMRVIAEDERLMPHFHLSLQAGDDLILKRMKRRHLRADSIRFCESIRRLRPDAAFGADLIAGFPTETESQFDNTLALVGDCDLTFLHVFPFSPRTGTPAARMPAVTRQVVKQRAARLRAAGDAALAQRLASEIGQIRSVLVEKEGFGRTEHYAVAAVDHGAPGAIVRARIESAGARSLSARVLQSLQGEVALA